MKSDKDCVTALEEMELLLKYCELYKVQDKVRIVLTAEMSGIVGLKWWIRLGRRLTRLLL